MGQCAVKGNRVDTMMVGLRRRTVVEWFRCQSKFKVMWNSDANRFHLRDVKNNIAVGEFWDSDGAMEFAFDLAHDTLGTANDIR